MVTIAMVIPTWGKVCGIACYTKNLIEHAASLQTKFKVHPQIAGLTAAVRNGAVDIVHIQHEYSFFEPNTIYRHMKELSALDVPVVTTIHSLCPHLVEQNRIITELSARVIVHSEDMKQLHAMNGCDPGKLEVVPMGVHPVAVRPAGKTKKKFGLDGFPCIGFFGFPFPQKGIINLIDALQILQVSLPDLKGYFFTASPDFSGLDQDGFQQRLQVKFSQNPHLYWFNDFLPEETLVNLLHCMDVNVLPYLKSMSQGISSASKMLLAAGRPVVTTDTLYFSDLRDEVYKIPNAEPETIARAIGAILSDRDLQERLMAGGNSFMQNNNWHKIGALYRAFYQGISARSGSGAQLATGSGILTGNQSDTKQGRMPVRWTSNLFEPSGYASEARNVLLHLDEGKYDLKVIPIGNHRDVFMILNGAHRSKLYRLLEAGERPGALNVVWSMGSSFVRRHDARVNIGRTMFETDRIPPAWVRACNQMDEIWVPSYFNVETFAGAGVAREKLVILPGGVDPDFYASGAEPAVWPDKKGFNFLSVFIWVFRKGWDILLRAFAAEFTRKDDVALILKINVPPFCSLEQIKRQAFDAVRSLGVNMADVPDIHIIADNYTDNEMASLYAACDAFILASRGEGWGRPYMEAMARGLPVIGTRWSGQLEFMNDQNSYLINVEALESVPRQVDMPVYRGQRWARPSLEHTRALMRHVYENREEARRKGIVARQEAFEKWSLRRMVSEVEKRLDYYR